MSILIVPHKFAELFHDRAIVTKNKALDIGPSLNGLGTSIQKITELEANEAKDLENSFVDKMLNYTTWFLDHKAQPTHVVVNEN